MTVASLQTEHLQRVVEPGDLPVGFLHVVVFGPGHGEAVLVRMPDGRVGVVDGCGKEPSASGRGSPIFPLVAALGIERLLFACLTHPHADHFSGFAELIQKYSPEHLWWSGKQERKFFQHYREYLQRRGCDAEAGDEEPKGHGLQRLVETIHAIAEGDAGANLRPRTQFLEDRKLLLDIPVKVESILPSTRGVQEAEKDALQVLEANDLQDTTRRFNPNRISAALLLTWGETRVLLGGDALRENDPDAGWDGLPFALEKINLIKVAHHASEGAHSEKLWAAMQPDLAVVTCVRDATGDQPPRPEMLETLLQTGSNVTLTARPDWWDSGRRGLQASPSDWRKPNPPAVAGNAVLGSRARTASAANKHENAVVVRLDNKGTIVKVQLHGAARQLHLTQAPTK